MQVIRLMGACSNRCAFCMVGSEIEAAIHRPLESVVDEIHRFPPGTVFDLFGGEPTLYPQFRELLTHLHDQQIAYQIASNGRIFANPEFTDFVCSKCPVQVRTSLYGATESTHDTLTRVEGSWKDTLTGVANMVKARIQCSVNYLIMETNYFEILEATALLYRLGIRLFKFSLPIHAVTLTHLLASLTQVRPLLACVLDELQLASAHFELEKMPFCLAPQHLSHFFMENDPAMIAGGRHIYAKPDVCAECALHTYCHGVEMGYLQRYGAEGIQPILDTDLDPADIVALTPDELLRFQPSAPFTLVRISDPLACANADFVLDYIEKFARFRQHGMLIGIL